MLLAEFNARVLSAALAILPAHMDSSHARVMLLSIGLQESELCYNCQLGNGPAHGKWMFERVGVAGVLNDPRTAALAETALLHLSVPHFTTEVYARLPTDDVLAAVVARLLLWSDPRPLPALGDVEGAWQCYLRNWRPGKPRPHDWPLNYAKAMSVIQGEAA